MGKRQGGNATPIFHEIVMRDFRVGAVEIRRAHCSSSTSAARCLRASSRARRPLRCRAQRYWLHTGLIAVMVLLAYDLMLLNEKAIGALLIVRMIDILLGCALALVGTSVAFPREATGKLGRAPDRAS
jgi:hypothetical protein